MSQIKLFPALLGVALTKNIQVGIISDTHFNTAYNQFSSTNLCTGSEVSTELQAPLGRYGCDSPESLIDLMFTRFKEVFGEVDLILVPGDSVAHKVATSHGGDDSDGSHYAAVKSNLVATFQKFKQYFPNTMILPTIGNNDGRYKDEAIDETDKSDYYGLVYDLWFTELAGNASLDRVAINKTIMDGAYYRADVAPNVSVLSINSMYFDFKDDQMHQNEARNIMYWFDGELALAKAEGRKVIIMDHVYAGSSNDTPQPWYDNYNQWYFEVLRKYSEQILIEVVGHDHIADLRYHSSSNVLDLQDIEPQFYFHNMIVAPGVTPYDFTNPGVGKFEITSELVPQNLHLEFLNLQATIDQQVVEFYKLDFPTEYGVTQLDAASLDSWFNRLNSDDKFTTDYLVSKIGFNPSVESQFLQGFSVLVDLGLLNQDGSTSTFLCQMNQSVSPTEYQECLLSQNRFLY